MGCAGDKEEKKGENELKNEQLKRSLGKKAETAPRCSRGITTSSMEEPAKQVDETGFTDGIYRPIGPTRGKHCQKNTSPRQLEVLREYRA